jgi:hypothetical protein
LWYGGICLGSDDVRNTGGNRCTAALEERIIMDTTAASSTVSSIIAAVSYDESYRFGRRPTVRAPFPFTERQFARLLIVRSRVQAAPSTVDQLAA